MQILLKGNVTKQYFYSNEGGSIYFKYNNQIYYYKRGLINSDGDEVVIYTYNAYGKLLLITGDYSLGQTNY